MARREDLLCGQGRGHSCGQVRGLSLWPGARAFYVARREGLLRGQVRGLSVWSGARTFSVARREAILCGKARAPSCGQVKTP